MKKTLIIASCGLIVALIIGATTQQRLGPPLDDIKMRFNNARCIESGNDKQKSECASRAVQHKKDVRSEIFMRPIKRKARIAYA